MQSGTGPKTTFFIKDRGAFRYKRRSRGIGKYPGKCQEMLAGFLNNSPKARARLWEFSRERK